MIKQYIQNSFTPDFSIKEEDNNLIVDGLFIVFNERGKIGETISGTEVFEEILPEAIDLEENLKNRDIAVLWNHDSSKVLARSKNGTLILSKDEKGIHGTFKINPEDTEAKSCYEKIKSGLVYQNSFGFYVDDNDIQIIREEDGSITQKIKKLDLVEISPCTFPVYEGTTTEARQKKAQNISLSIQKEELKEKIRKIKEENTNE